MDESRAGFCIFSLLSLEAADSGLKYEENTELEALNLKGRD